MGPDSKHHLAFGTRAVKRGRDAERQEDEGKKAPVQRKHLCKGNACAKEMFVQKKHLCKVALAGTV